MAFYRGQVGDGRFSPLNCRRIGNVNLNQEFFGVNGWDSRKKVFAILESLFYEVLDLSNLKISVNFPIRNSQTIICPFFQFGPVEGFVGDGA